MSWWYAALSALGSALSSSESETNDTGQQSHMLCSKAVVPRSVHMCALNQDVWQDAFYCCKAFDGSSYAGTWVMQAVHDAPMPKQQRRTARN